ncbi:hypothetical protein [Tissierella sp.]|uniref:hypothetical protein n=1 Tax=Tissierella sp. TaxID=41274 RepID=UPI0028A718B8|nr:hypothetical protein [Tissierella sp.]
MKNKDIVTVIIIITSLVILDYLNIFSILGFNMPNINFDFWIGVLNIIVIIILYKITYKKIDEKAIEREKNKYSISVLLLQEVYRECRTHMNLLNQETVEKYIVPKMDFNSTDFNNSIIGNLQSTPFLNENTIMDFVKDGQINKMQIEGYLKVKEKYRQYINMRIILFDRPDMYEPLKIDLDEVIEYETKQLDTQS